MKLIVSAKKVLLAKAMIRLFFLMVVAGAAVGIATTNETVLIILCLSSLIPWFISYALVDGLFRCPNCRTQLQRTDVSRLHLVLHPDDLPRFCQKCGWEVQVENEE